MAVILAVRAAPREIQKQMREQTKKITTPEFEREMAEQLSLSAGYRVQDRVLVKTARVAISNQNIRLSSATVGRKLRGGLNPKTQYAALEFGADRGRRSTYDATSRRGKRYTVTNRRTAMQLPRRNKNGWIFYPAVAEITPRILALWAQTVVRVLGEAFDGKTS